MPSSAASASERASLTALRAALGEASADGFAGVADPELGPRLRTLVAALLGSMGADSGAASPPDAPQWLELSDALAPFDGLGRQDRSVVVAKAMRLSMSWVAQDTPAPGRKRSTRRMVAVGAARVTPQPEAKATKKTSAKKTSAKKTSAKKTSAKKTSAKKTSAKKTSAKKTSAKKTVTPAVSEPPDDDFPVAPACDVLSGVGPTIASKLAARGLHTLEDLAYTLPTRYYDLRSPQGVEDVADGETAVVHGTIVSFKQGFFSRRYMATLEVETETGCGVQARWFHRGGLGNRVETGDAVTLVGPVKRFRDRPSMVHPDVYTPDSPPPAIMVKYPVVDGMGPKVLARSCARALQHGRDHGWLIDILPADIAETHGLPPLSDALAALHEPEAALSEAEVVALAEARSPAHRRLAFEEFFLLQLSLARHRDEYCRGRAGLVVPEDAWDRERLRACLPFEPTGGQWTAIEDLARDMHAGEPMLRLLQGDVGSGKTAVAFAAALAVAEAGGQTAFMAPTEILAEQHLKTLTPWCERAGLKVALLTGAVGRAERMTMLSLLAAGKFDILVGTHALIVGDVNFAQLSLAIVDEQHRFGVEQRATLRDKGDAPHLLVMTATPIPRTLALSAYGELEVSVIDEMPPGRTPPVTRVYHGKPGLTRARSVLVGAVGRGNKAFVVCPLVEASEAVQASDVEATAATLAAMLPEHRVSFVHGRMSSADKEAVMESFRLGEAQVLVATTVIEVGVDVPDARLILIEHAERFGLSQLHQLRGRVGRGGGPCACLVHTAAGKGSETAARLSILAQTHDGFVVAERDLALRGPGEMFGTRQAGVPRLRFSGFGGEGTRMLVAARTAAKALVAVDPDLEGHPQLRTALSRREAAAPIYSGDAG
ncbi:MAG: ATP-dependent DNA helicase RecG [Nannocystaceae bacterium]|nr:ATP-dependent DNA helicase RecG [Nannocystaceae bacterium]